MQRKLFALILLVCLVATPLAFLAKVEASSSPTLQQTGQLHLPSGIYIERTFASSGNFLYLYCEDQSSNLIILKIDQTTMTLVANYTSDTFTANSNYPLFVIGNYLYCLGYAYNDTSSGQQTYVVKIATSSMAVAGNFSDPNGNNVINSFGSDGTYLYINEYRQPPYDYVLYKIAPSTMTVTATSDSFAFGLNSLVSDNGTLLCQTQDNSLYQISTSNFAVTNYYQVSVNISSNFWSAAFFGSSNVFSGIQQHVIKFSYSDFSQVGEWNDPNPDYVTPLTCGNYLVAGLGGETFTSIAVIDPSTMTTLSTDSIDLNVTGYHMSIIMGANNFVYGVFSGGGSPLLMQLDIVSPSPSPTPAHHGGPVYTSTPIPSPTPLQSSIPSSGSVVTPDTPTRISSVEILVFTVAIALAVAITLLLLSRRR